MGQGIRFFGYDYALQRFGGTATVSSGDARKWYAADGLKATRWMSSGEGSDGTSVYFHRNFGETRSFDSIYIYDTNIDSPVVQYYDGFLWITLTDGINCTITKSDDEKHVFIKLNSTISVMQVKVGGSNTLTSNKEKYIGELMVFAQLGQFEYRPELEATYDPDEEAQELDNKKYFVIDSGERFEGELTLRSHVNQNDIDLVFTLLDRKAEFYIWPCGGSVSQFGYIFPPWRFENIYKVALVDKYKPQHTKNYYKAGLNVKLKLVEVS